MPHDWKELVVTGAVCLGIAGIAVSLRIWNRTKIMASTLRADDWWMLAALMMYMWFCSTVFAIAAVECRYPVMDYRAADLILMIEEIAEVSFLLMSIFLKISLSIFFRRFLVECWQKKVVWHTTAIYGSMSSFAVIVSIFQCGLPVHLSTKHLEQKCVPQLAFNVLLYFHGTFATLTDWIFALLPISLIYKSQMRTAEKISASTLLALAVSGSMVAILRTVTSVDIAIKADYFDPEYRPLYYWKLDYALELAVIETGLGITAGSLACCRLMFRRAASQWRVLLSSCSTTSDSHKLTPVDVEKVPQMRVESIQPRLKVGKCGILPTVPEYTVPEDTLDRAEVLFQGKLGILPTVPGDTVDLIDVIPPRSDSCNA